MFLLFWFEISESWIFRIFEFSNFELFDFLNFLNYYFGVLGSRANPQKGVGMCDDRWIVPPLFALASKGLALCEGLVGRRGAGGACFERISLAIFVSEALL